MGRLRRLTKDKIRRYRYEKWFWICTLIPAYLWLHDTKVITALSIYALIITAGGAEQAAEAATEAAKPDDGTDQE